MKNPIFENFILGLIIISSIHLALDRPLLDPNGTYKKVLDIIDICLTILFSVEAILKLIGFGILFNGPESYFRVSWNLLDFFIVVVSVVSLLNTDVDLSFFKILRLLRVLRPLRIIKRT